MQEVCDNLKQANTWNTVSLILMCSSFCFYRYRFYPFCRKPGVVQGLIVIQKASAVAAQNRAPLNFLCPWLCRSCPCFLQSRVACVRENWRLFVPTCSFSNGFPPVGLVRCRLWNPRKRGLSCSWRPRSLCLWNVWSVGYLKLYLCVCAI